MERVQNRQFRSNYYLLSMGCQPAFKATFSTARVWGIHKQSKIKPEFAVLGTRIEHSPAISTNTLSLSWAIYSALWDPKIFNRNSDRMSYFHSLGTGVHSTLAKMQLNSTIQYWSESIACSDGIAEIVIQIAMLVIDLSYCFIFSENHKSDSGPRFSVITGLESNERECLDEVRLKAESMSSEGRTNRRRFIQSMANRQTKWSISPRFNLIEQRNDTPEAQNTL